MDDQLDYNYIYYYPAVQVSSQQPQELNIIVKDLIITSQLHRQQPSTADCSTTTSATKVMITKQRMRKELQTRD